MKSNFWKEYSRIIIFTFSFFLLAYFFKLFFYSYSLDTEFFMVHPKAMLDSWIGIRRFSLVFLKQLYSSFPFSIFRTNWLTVLFFYIGSLISYFNFAKQSPKLKEKKSMIIYLCILGTSPIFLEQFNFTLQSFEIAFFYTIFHIGIFYFFKFLDSKTFKHALFAIICFVFSMGAYQSFVPMFITESILLFYLRLDQEKQRSKKEIVSFILLSIFFFLVSFLIYFGLSSLFIKEMHIESSNYLTGQIGWLHNDFLHSFLNIFKSFVRVYFGYVKHAYQFTFLNSFAFLFTCYLLITKLRGKQYLSMVTLFFILLSPLFMTFLLGNSEPIRAYITFPLVLAFLLSYERMEKKWYSTFIILGIFLQFSTMWMYEYNDYQRFLNDSSMAKEIYERVEDLLPGRALVFVGAKDSDLEGHILKGEALGISFFQHYGLSDRASTFMKSLGYSLEEDRAFIPEATELVRDKKSYPDEESIFVTDTHVIVKLS